MNRTIVSGTTISKIVPDKLTESMLSDEIHANMRVLGLMYPFSDELKTLFHKDMFVKPNTKAFPQVMRYLFMLLDPVEFRKKFTWPLYNKAQEATFRNSTLEYLERLNSKYGLGFGQLRNQLVVFPGGLEFLKVLHEVIKLVMRIISKKSLMSGAASERSLDEAQSYVEKMEQLHALCDVQCKKVSEYNKELSLRTSKMRQLIDKLTNGTDAGTELILDGSFERQCFDFQKHIVDMEIQPDLKKVKDFQQKCAKLESSIEKVFEKRTITYNEDAIYRFAAHMQYKYPELGNQFNRIIANREVIVDNLFVSFELIVPMIVEHVLACQPRSLASLKYELTAIDKLSQRVTSTYYNLMRVERLVGDRYERSNHRKEPHTPRASHLQSMILATPPMHYHAVQSAQRIPLCPKRISLSDNMANKRNQNQTTGGASKLSVISENMILLTPVQKSSSTPNTTLSPMRTVGDPLNPLYLMQVLEQKKQKRRAPRKFLSSSLAQLKWSADETYHTNVAVTPQQIPDTPNFSSTLNEPSTYYDGNHLVVASDTNTHVSPVAEKSSNNRRNIRSNYNKSLNVSEIIEPQTHRSPSGRIDARYNNECDKLSLRKIRTSNEQLLDNIVSNEPMATSSPSAQKTREYATESSFEMDQSENHLDLRQKLQNPFNQDNDDESMLNINDISDSVLNNIY